MRRRRTSGRAWDEGFTLLETLVEVLLVALALGVLASLTATTFEAWKRASAAVEARAERELFAAALDQVANRIRVPFYENPAWGEGWEPTRPGRPLLIPWYRGNPEATLELGTDGQSLWLRTWDANFTLPFPGSIAPWVDEGRVVGLVLESSGQTRRVHFASVPVGVRPR